MGRIIYTIIILILLSFSVSADTVKYDTLDESERDDYVLTYYGSTADDVIIEDGIARISGKPITLNENVKEDIIMDGGEADVNKFTGEIQIGSGGLIKAKNGVFNLDKGGTITVVDGVVVCEDVNLNEGSELNGIPLSGTHISYDETLIKSNGILKIHDLVLNPEGDGEFIVFIDSSVIHFDSGDKFISIDSTDKKYGRVKGRASLDSIKETLLIDASMDRKAIYITPEETSITLDGLTCVGRSCEETTLFSRIWSNYMSLYIEPRNNIDVEVHTKNGAWHELSEVQDEYSGDYLKRTDYAFTTSRKGHRVISIAEISDESNVNVYVHTQKRLWNSDDALPFEERMGKLTFSKDLPIAEGNNIGDIITDFGTIYEDKKGDKYPWVFRYGEMLSKDEFGEFDEDYSFIESIEDPKLKSDVVKTFRNMDGYVLKGLDDITHSLVTGYYPRFVMDALTGGYGRSVPVFAHYLHGSGESMEIEIDDGEWEFMIDQSKGKAWREGNDGWERVYGIEGGINNYREEEDRTMGDLWNMLGFTTLARKKISPNEYEYKVEETFDFYGSQTEGQDYVREMPYILAKAAELFYPDIIDTEEIGGHYSGHGSSRLEVRAKGGVLEEMGRPFSLESGTYTRKELNVAGDPEKIR